jgi:hypothetical protein
MHVYSMLSPAPLCLQDPMGRDAMPPDMQQDGLRMQTGLSLTPTYNQLLPRNAAQQQQQQQQYRTSTFGLQGANPQPQQHQHQQHQHQQHGQEPGPFLRALMSIGTLPPDFGVALSNTAANVLGQGPGAEAAALARPAPAADPLQAVQSLRQQFQQTRNLHESLSLIIKNFDLDPFSMLHQQQADDGQQQEQQEQQQGQQGQGRAVESGLKDIASLLLEQMQQALEAPESLEQQAPAGLLAVHSLELQNMLGQLRTVDSIRRQQQQEQQGGGQRKRPIAEQQQQEQQEQDAKRQRHDSANNSGATAATANASGDTNATRRSKISLAEKLARMRSPFAASPALFQEVSTGGAASGAVSGGVSYAPPSAQLGKHDSITSRKPVAGPRSLGLPLASIPSFTIRRMQPADDGAGPAPDPQTQPGLVLPAGVAAMLSGAGVSHMAAGAGGFVIAELAEMPPGGGSRQLGHGMRGPGDFHRYGPSNSMPEEADGPAFVSIPLDELVNGLGTGDVGQQLASILSSGPAAAGTAEVPMGLMHTLSSQLQQRGGLPEGTMLVQLAAGMGEPQ